MSALPLHDLAQMTSGFRDATLGAQQSFRCLLSAMAGPGQVLSLPSEALDGVTPPNADLSLGATALLLSLLDADTRLLLNLDSAQDAASAHAYFRFHTGAVGTAQPGEADFSLVPAPALSAEWWTQLRQGSDDNPQLGATLLIEVSHLEHSAQATGCTLTLRGPGIEHEQTLSVGGLPADFWAWRQAQQALMPRGVDLVLVCGTRIAALPRSTRLHFTTAQD